MDFQFSHQEVASSSPLSSPTTSTRRFSQYKSRTSGSSFVPTRQNRPGSSSFQSGESQEKSLWKEKVRQQVALRAKAERHKRHERGRSEDPNSDASSEGGVYPDEDDNMDDLDDELYRRVMIEERRRQAHYAKMTYEREFGDSDDVLMDVEEFEQQFQPTSSQEAAHNATYTSNLPPNSQITAEEDPEKLYEAYLPDIQAQAEEEDEFENEFEDIDPQTLAAMLDRQ